MKPRMILLIAATALPVALALPSLGYRLAGGTTDIATLVQAPAASAATAPLGNLVIASADDERGKGWIFGRDDDDAQAGCASPQGDDDDDEDGACVGGSSAAPAAAGTVAPPANGLFAPGGSAVVNVN